MMQIAEALRHFVESFKSVFASAGVHAVEGLFGNMIVKPYTIVFCLIAIALLSPVVLKLTKQYFANK